MKRDQHDPLCKGAPYKDAAQISIDDGAAFCQCELITTVRADERQAEANRRAERFGVWHDYDPGFP